MRLRRSLIDDVRASEETNSGPPILSTNQNIRKMLALAAVGKGDVFYDLGSGWGQNLIVALTEFGVRRPLELKFEGNEFLCQKNA